MSAPTVSLEKERLDRGLSLNGMAKKIGVSRGTLQRAIDGEEIHPGNALKIAEFLGKKPTELWPLEESEATA